MRVFYDKEGNRISKANIREKMTKEATGTANRTDKKIKEKIIKGMSVEQYARLNGMSYKDFDKKKK